MLKLSASQLALTAILAFVLVLVVGVLSTQARNNRQVATRSANIPSGVQTAPAPVGTYPRPVPSYPAPIPSYEPIGNMYPPPKTPTNEPTAKPTREPRPTATPHPWLRYVEVLPTAEK
ncbi:MAG: hypothetical protein QOH93_3452 [Chloroflexia bacterium]|jgi:hypothetical protein|nr:hypothetical protein [Chloroflexia bacterium]